MPNAPRFLAVPGSGSGGGGAQAVPTILHDGDTMVLAEDTQTLVAWPIEVEPGGQISDEGGILLDVGNHEEPTAIALQALDIVIASTITADEPTFGEFFIRFQQLGTQWAFALDYAGLLNPTDFPETIAVLIP